MTTNPRLTRLQAVNRILRGAGEQPVNSLSDDGVNDVSLAESCLDENTTKILMEGGYTNTEILTYEPDSNGYINLPVGTLDVDATEYGVEVTQRGYAPCRLYDLENNTYVFDAEIELKITYSLAFEDLPPATQFYITDVAAVEYQMNTKGDPSLDRHLREVALRSKIRHDQQNSAQGQYNIFDNSNLSAYWTRNRNRAWRNRSLMDYAP